MNFCTYFDSNYLLKGLVCYNTLLSFLKDELKFYILCLDDKTISYFSNFSNIEIIKIEDIENYCPELLLVKNKRQPREYYATISPILPLYIFDKYNNDVLFYTDADIAFWSDPHEILSIFGNNSILAVDHGYEPPIVGSRFNVGILGYRNDTYCRDFLNWWKESCLDWCGWKPESYGKFADQGYLNVLHDDKEKFKNFISCPHPGVNLGPWNIAKHTISEIDGKPIVDCKYNLICYHYHEFSLTKDSYIPTYWKITNDDIKIIYEPYFKLMKKLGGF